MLDNNEWKFAAPHPDFQTHYIRRLPHTQHDKKTVAASLGPPGGAVDFRAPGELEFRTNPTYFLSTKHREQQFERNYVPNWNQASDFWKSRANADHAERQWFELRTLAPYQDGIWVDRGTWSSEPVPVARIEDLCRMY